MNVRNVSTVGYRGTSFSIAKTGVTGGGGGKESSGEVLGGKHHLLKGEFGLDLLTASSALVLGFALGKQHKSARNGVTGGGGGKESSGEVLGGHKWLSGEKLFWLGATTASAGIFFGLYAVRKSVLDRCARPLIEASLPGLPLMVDDQEEEEWCWAAVTVGLTRYYYGSVVRQCQIAAEEFPNRGCCSSGRQNCNVAHTLDGPLNRRRLLVRGPENGPLDLDDLRREIQARRPVAARVEWPDGFGHFVVISDCSDTPAGPVLTIRDPWYRDSQVLYAEFASEDGGYLTGNGKWTHSYYLRDVV